jgi:holliday junction DNA helicase RuvA
MIEYLNGIITEIEQLNNKVSIEVYGVGYSINVSNRTLNHLLPFVNNKKNIIIYITETNSMYSGTNTLYGFLSKDERELFQVIKNVNKIGAKGALDILSRIGNKTNDFKFFIMQNNSEKLHEIFGFTEAKAEKLILGLKNKINSISSDLDNKNINNEEQTENNIQNFYKPFEQHKEDAIEALKTLGYNAIKAKKVVYDILNSLDTKIDINLEEIIKLALKKM